MAKLEITSAIFVINNTNILFDKIHQQVWFKEITTFAKL